MQSFGFQNRSQQIAPAPGLNPWALMQQQQQQQPLGGQDPKTAYLSEALQSLADQDNSIRSPQALGSDMLAEALLQHAYKARQGLTGSAPLPNAISPMSATVQQIDPSQLQGIQQIDPSQLFVSGS